MYKEYWGFIEKPFENTPDPRFFYCSSKHEEALTRLLYAVQERKGAAMLSGEYGSGKTLLSRVIISKLLQQEDKYKFALVVNPAIPVLELLGEILYQLGGDNANQNRKTDILRNINDILYNTASNNRHTIIIIDEAQAIADDTVFEELRLLLNFQLNERFLLTLLLLGQPELREKVERIPQFKQRLALRYHLTTLTEPETARYIEYRCKTAGKNESVFTEDAYKSIYAYSNGIPRLINNACDLGLVIGMGEKTKYIDAHIIDEVIRDFKQGEEAIEKIDEKIDG